MAWAATLYQINKDSERPTVVILFTDGVKYKRLETLQLDGHTSTSFRATVENMRTNFESSFSFIDSLTLDFQLKPDDKPVSSPAEAARSKYFKDLFVLQGMKQAIVNGLITEADKVFIDQQAIVKSEFLPEYLGL